MTEKDVINKIAKLLALTESPNENEANMAMKKADELMALYNITTDQIEATNECAKYTKQEAALKEKIDTVESMVLTVLNCGFFVQVLINRVWSEKHKKRMAHIIIVGKPTNVKIAQQVRIFLNKEVPILWKKIKEERNLTTKAKSSFYYGLMLGILHHIEEGQKDAEQSTGLMVIEDKGLEKYVKDEFADAKERKQKVPAEERDAIGLGFEIGKKINITKGI